MVLILRGQNFIKVSNSLLEPIVQRSTRFPTKFLLSKLNIGSTAFRVIVRQLHINYFVAVTGAATTFSAKAKIVNSSGLPIFTGPVKSSPVFIVRTRASTRSST